MGQVRREKASRALPKSLCITTHGEFKVIAESFATIVSLLGQYRAEKGNQAKLEYEDFMEWLVTTNHTEIKSLLELNTKATISIKALLNQDHKIFKQKLDKIDSALTSFASAIDGFSELANSVNPNAVLSEQALSILKQFQESGASKALELKVMGGPQYLFIDADGGLEMSEPRFISDDFYILIELGLLRQDYNSKGDNLYVFTRAAERLVSNNDS